MARLLCCAPAPRSPTPSAPGGEKAALKPSRKRVENPNSLDPPSSQHPEPETRREAAREPLCTSFFSLILIFVLRLKSKEGRTVLATPAKTAGGSVTALETRPRPPWWGHRQVPAVQATPRCARSRRPGRHPPAAALAEAEAVHVAELGPPQHQDGLPCAPIRPLGRVPETQATHLPSSRSPRDQPTRRPTPR